MTSASRKLRDFKKGIGLSTKELDSVFRASWSTAWRRLGRTGHPNISNLEISVRIERLTSIWEALGKPSATEFMKFLKTRNEALGGFEPRDLLSSFGVHEVLEYIRKKRKS